MDFVHRSNHSEWDDEYTNVRVNASDVHLAAIIIAAFALAVLIV